MIRRAMLGMALIVSMAGCLARPAASPGAIVVSMTNGPNNLDPRFGTDDASQKIHQLIFDNLMEIDDHLRVVPHLAERLDRVDPLTYVASLRHGVRFHDGHELTSADVVYTFRGFLDPALLSTRKTAFRSLKAVEARDRYTVVFTLSAPFRSFPSSLVMPVVPAGAGLDLREKPMGTGPYQFVRYDTDDVLELRAFPGYFAGAPRNAGLLLRILPDEVMRGLELRKGTIDLVVNDVSPDIVQQLEHQPRLAVTTGPGTDFQYIGINLRDPALGDVRVRQALTYAIDRQAIVDHLRRGLALLAVGFLPPVSWAFTPDVMAFPYNPARARTLLDAAGYPDPGGDGSRPRLRLSLKVSNTEFNRLQATVIQQNLRDVGIALDVRTYEFATLYADVLSGNFQLYSLQWSGGALADPDILRQIFHSSQTPPKGFNRGHFADAQVDAWLDAATSSDDDATRGRLYTLVQQRLVEQVPYVGLWFKTNYTIAQRDLTGINLAPTASLTFLQHVSRGEAKLAH